MIKVNVLETQTKSIFFHKYEVLAKRFSDDYNIKEFIEKHIYLLLRWYKRNYRFCHYIVINKVILIKIHDI